MKVNDEELKGIAIIDNKGGIVAYISDEGVYFRREHKIELIPPNMEVYIDKMTGDYQIKNIGKDEEYILEESDYLS